MPFTETDIVDERTRFIEDTHRSMHSFTWLCGHYGISRKTGYEWLDRWRTHGPEGLRNRSSRPIHCPWATPPEVVEAILGVRRTYTERREEDPVVPREAQSRARPALSHHDPQHSASPRSRQATQENPTLASGPTRCCGRRAQSELECRLQGPPDPRRTAAIRSPSRTCTRVFCSTVAGA